MAAAPGSLATSGDFGAATLHSTSLVPSLRNNGRPPRLAASIFTRRERGEALTSRFTAKT